MSTTSKTGRSLFGPLNHNEIQAELKNLIRLTIDESSLQWNFDFYNNRPAKVPSHSLEWTSEGERAHDTTDSVVDVAQAKTVLSDDQLELSSTLAHVSLNTK